MLYTTTRSDHDTYTPERALKERRAPDGGLYVPMQWKSFTKSELAAILNQSPTGILASVMNHFFSCRLTDRDIEFYLGKEILTLGTMSHRVITAEYWHNMDGDITRLQKVLAERAAIDKRETPVGEWMQVASRIGMLFCAFGMMLQRGEIHWGTKLDVAVLAGNFAAPMAAWYAKKMGLPIGNIICSCNENGAVWDLLQRGEMKTKPLVQKTNTPRCDIARPEGIERLIQSTLGANEACRYAWICEEGGVYAPGTEQHKLLREGMYASVIGDRRIPRVIASTYAANGYILCPYSALIYSGLMDYRSATGQNGPALMMIETSPLKCEDAVAKAMGIPPSRLHELLDITV